MLFRSLVAERLAGKDVRPINYDHVPGCTYCDPEIGSVGLTEAEAKKRGAKSVVRRDVVRLVTPGTITEEALLDPARANSFAAVARSRAPDGGWRYGLASVDISTGAFTVAECGEAELAAELTRLEPREIVASEALDRKSTRLNSSHSQQSRMPSSA